MSLTVPNQPNYDFVCIIVTASEVRQMYDNSHSNALDNALDNASNGHATQQNTVTSRTPRVDSCQRVSQTCQQIVSDLTSSRVCQSTVDQSHHPSLEEDTYTTFVFTKAPISEQPRVPHAGSDSNHRATDRTQGTHANQEENIYVKMYPPKQWRQNGYIQPNASQQPKSVKHVGFSDLVNSDNVRGLPESRRVPERHPYHSESLVDITEVDTNGYMSLSQVRRATDEETVYASIEPLNGSYINDNASEISECTYSKSLSKASQHLYPFLTKPAMSSRQQLQQHLQQQQQRHQYQYQRSMQVHPNNLPSQQRTPATISHNPLPMTSPQRPAHITLPAESSVRTELHTRLGHTDSLTSPKSDQLYSDSNVHNDSGICDNDSSPKSDGECSDNAFVYNQKPNGNANLSVRNNKLPAPGDSKHSIVQKHALAATSMVNINSARTPTLERRTPLTPQTHRHSSQVHPARDVMRLQVSDTPQWSRARCTNDSCVEDNDGGGTHSVTHTPSCPYHVCANCNGIVPHYSHPSQAPAPSHGRAADSQGYSDVTHSAGNCSSDEEDFGYMSMEKFNIYKDTVLKHHQAPVECSNHDTVTKIYFL